MRHLVIICFTILLAVSVSAETRSADVLLNDSGVFYRVESMSASAYNEAHPEFAVATNASSILVLTIQAGDEVSSVPVPGSLADGVNIEPSLAYDANDDRIYVFWQRQPSPSSSELLLTSYKDGIWTNTTTFDNGIWRLRFNLRIRLTHYVTVTDEEGRPARTRTTIAHAVWWEQHGAYESARYAMLDVREGAVTGLSIHAMNELSSLSEPPALRELPENYDKAIFRAPFILDVPGSDSVDILFADWYTNHYEVVNVRPVLDEKDGVIHIPIGVTTGVMDGPMIEIRDSDSALMAMNAPSPDGSRDILLYFADGDAVDYVIYRNGTWSDSRRIMLGGAVTLGEAVMALRRNISRN